MKSDDCKIVKSSTRFSSAHKRQQWMDDLQFQVLFNIISIIVGQWEDGKELYLQLTLKSPITTAADDIHIYFFTVFQRKKKT